MAYNFKVFKFKNNLILMFIVVIVFILNDIQKIIILVHFINFFYIRENNSEISLSCSW